VYSGGLAPLMHDVHFNLPEFELANGIAWRRANGVIADMTIESTDVASSCSGGGSNGSGAVGFLHKPEDSTWNTAGTMGTGDSTGLNNLYIEESTFINVRNSVFDLDDDARTVIRYSTFRNSQIVTHSATSMRGGRHLEVYNTAFEYRSHAANGCAGVTTVDVNRYYWSRGGTSLFTDNTFENITSGDWGNRNEMQFMVEPLTRPGSNPCCTSYMCLRQSGAGHNGTSQISDPVYLWNNTGTLVWGTLDHGPPPGGQGIQECIDNGLSSSTFFVLDRDIFVGTARPSYTKYTYPHPIR
jgi:hypothetical protein